MRGGDGLPAAGEGQDPLRHLLDKAMAAFKAGRDAEGCALIDEYYELRKARSAPSPSQGEGPSP